MMETFLDNLTQGQEAAAKKKKKEDWHDMYKESERRRRKMREKEIKQVVKAINIKKSPSSSSSTLSTISLSTGNSSVDSRGKKNTSFKMDDNNNIHDGEGGAADACMRASHSVRHFIEYFIC